MKVHLEEDPSVCRVFNFRLNSQEMRGCPGSYYPVVRLWFWEVLILWAAPKFVDWLSSFMARRLIRRYIMAAASVPDPAYERWKAEQKGEG